MGYIFAADSIQILVVGFEKHVCNATECIIAVQGHCRVNQGRGFWSPRCDDVTEMLTNERTNQLMNKRTNTTDHKTPPGILYSLSTTKR